VNNRIREWCHFASCYQNCATMLINICKHMIWCTTSSWHYENRSQCKI